MLEGWLACAEELGCYASDDDLRRCDEASAISVEPSRLAFEFCTRLAALELQCGYWTDRSRCAETVKGWNDATFEAAMRCTEEAVVGCEGTWDCFDDVVRGER